MHIQEELENRFTMERPKPKQELSPPFQGKQVAPNPQARAAAVKALAQDLGFLDCGIAEADYLADEAPRLAKWLDKGMNGRMQYMNAHTELRLDPRLLLHGARSVIVLLSNYYPRHSHMQLSTQAPKIARYAYGRDYHRVLRNKLRVFAQGLQARIGQVAWRACVDSAPVMESVWAARAGLGWKGKHSLLIHKKYGSFFFLCVLLTDANLATDTPDTDHCGDCTRCIDACPTDAIRPHGTIDARRCIAYWTIEDKNPIPEPLQPHLNDWLFGCDVCQDVCPWNRFAVPHQEEAFAPTSARLALRLADWQQMQRSTFDTLFAGSALRRAGYDKLQHTLSVIASKSTKP